MCQCDCECQCDCQRDCECDCVSVTENECDCVTMIVNVIVSVSVTVSASVTVSVTVHCYTVSHHLRLGLPNGLFPSGLLMYVHRLSPIRATCPTHLTVLYFFSRIIFGEEYRS